MDFLGTCPYHDKKTAREVVGDHVVGHLENFAVINQSNYVPNLLLSLTMAVNLNNFVERHMATANASKVHTAVNLFLALF